MERREAVKYISILLGGAVIGLSYGLLLGSFFNKRFGFANFDQETNFS